MEEEEEEGLWTLPAPIKRFHKSFNVMSFLSKANESTQKTNLSNRTRGETLTTNLTGLVSQNNTSVKSLFISVRQESEHKARRQNQEVI